MDKEWWEIYNNNETFFASKGFSRQIATTLRTEGKEALLGPWDAFCLFSQAKKIPAGGLYLEVGSAYGGSIVCVFLATRMMGITIKYIAIDPFVPYREPRSIYWTKDSFIKNVMHIPHVILINASSNDAKDILKDNLVDLLFIDGPMGFEQTLTDIKNYLPKVRPDGVLLGHGYRKQYKGVIRAVASAFPKGDFIIPKESGIWMVEKKDET